MQQRMTGIKGSSSGGSVRRVHSGYDEFRRHYGRIQDLGGYDRF